MTLKNQKFITVNSKCYPYHNDGGTCFTSYEIAKTADFIGYESSVIIPRIFERKKTEFYKKIEIKRYGYISFYRDMKNLMQSKNSIIYYNCAYNFHIILTLFAIVVNILLGKKTEAKVLFSGHGSFANSLSKKIYKTLWIIVFIKPFLVLSKAKYVANAKGELDDLCPQIKNLEIQFNVAENRFPSFIFEDEFSMSKYAKEYSHGQRHNNYALYLGRIVKKKQLVETIEFLYFNHWFKNGFKLLVAHSNDDLNYLKDVKLKIKELALSKNVIFLGKISGHKKWDLILNAKAFILLSISEGLPMTLLEADTLGVPIVCTESCNYLPKTKNSIILKELDEKVAERLNTIKQSTNSSFESVKKLNFDQIHLMNGFYLSFKEIFNE